MPEAINGFRCSFSPIRSEDEYRKYAAASLSLASKQSKSADKSSLLRVAEAWLDLADRIAERAEYRRYGPINHWWSRCWVRVCLSLSMHLSWQPLSSALRSDASSSSQVRALPALGHGHAGPSGGLTRS